MSDGRSGHRRLFRLPWRSSRDLRDEVDDELRFHLDLRTDELIRAGEPPARARQRAVREFGDLSATRRYCLRQASSRERRSRQMIRLGELVSDLRFGFRQLRRSPGFAMVAILTLALAAAGTTTIFAVVDSVILAPLPYRSPERLVRLLSTFGSSTSAVSAADFRDWRAGSRSYSAMAFLDIGPANVTGGGGDAERASRVTATANLFTTLGVSPMIGRGFGAEDGAAGAPRVTVLAESFWRRRFGADPAIVGQTIELDGQTHTIVGVLADGSGYPLTGDLWVPEEPGDDRGDKSYLVLARLADGVTMAAAEAELTVIAARIAAEHPESNRGFGARVIGLRDRMIGDVRRPLLMLLGAVGFVLVIAAANVASLVLARSTARTAELGVRSALGAGRSRLMRQLLTENLVLSSVAGAVGLGLAAGALRLIKALAPVDIPRLAEASLDGRVLLATLALVALTGLAVGLLPALQGSRARLGGHQAGRVTAAGSTVRLRNLLVTVEVAMAVVLLAGAGLLVKSFVRLSRVDPGFETRNVATFRVDLTGSRYDSDEKVRGFVGSLLERIGESGVATAAGAAFGFNFNGAGATLTYEVAGRTEPLAGAPRVVAITLATPGFFDALGVRLVSGRALTALDHSGAPKVVLINETAARRLFPNEAPLGRTITIGWTVDGVARGGEIVGVMEDLRQGQMDGEVIPEVFLPFDQNPYDRLTFVLRGEASAGGALAAGRSAVRALDPTLAVYGASALDDVVAESIAGPRFYATLLGAFSIFALVLSAVGVYGVVAYLVGQRTREIGIRIALGADRGAIHRRVLLDGAKLAGLGIAIGGGAALGLTRVLAGLLYQVNPGDPVPLLTGAALLFAVVIGTTWLPARRAARVDPLIAIRSE